MTKHSVTLVEALWDKAQEGLEPSQICFVMVTDAKGTAFRHNVPSVAMLAAILREFAGKFEAGEAWDAETPDAH